MQRVVKEIINEIKRAIFDKEQEIKLSLASFFAGGHLLIEDIPGVGKTSLAKSLAKVLGLEFKRVQFTSDLLPSDILGVNIFDLNSNSFEFKKGPIFTQVLLADEINRATPKTQSALLEAMEERQVSIDGTTHKLPEPFFVIATQNPKEELGVFELPESQLDRFFITINLGYPSKEFEKMLIRGKEQIDTNLLETKITKEQILKIKEKVKRVTLSEEIVEYIYNIAKITREPIFELSLSTRATLILTKMAKAWSFMDGRDFVIPEDVQDVLEFVLAKRVKKANLSPKELSKEIISLVKVN